MRAAHGGPLNPAEPPSMLAVDPPDHTRYRTLVTRAFSARAVAALRGRVEEIAEELLDAMATRAASTGSVDLVADYASLLPATVIAEMLGAPVAMREQFLQWGAGAAIALDPGLTLPRLPPRRARPSTRCTDGCSGTSTEIRRVARRHHPVRAGRGPRRRRGAL